MEELQTYLLGYLKPEQWASAIIERPDDKDSIIELIKEQEFTYAFSLLDDVNEILEEREE